MRQGLAPSRRLVCRVPLRLVAVLLFLLSPAAGTPPTLAEAEAATVAGELEHAQQLLERTLREPPPSPRALELLSTVHRRLGNTDDALAYADRAVALAPNRSAAHVTRTRALRQQLAEAGGLSAVWAIRAIDASTERAVALAPKDVDALMDRGHFFLYAPSLVGGDLDGARDIVARLAPLDRVASVALDVARLRRQDELEAALARCRAGLEAHPDAQALHFLLGRLRNEAQDPAGAERAFRSALVGPDETARLDASYKLAKLLIQRGSETDEALTLLRAYLDGLRRSDLLNAPSAAWLWIGRAHEGRGRNADARAAYEKALEYDPGQEQARSALAKLRGR
ncbi:MAG: tetratricopeptide repeat protein [Myxococcota bacterium]